MYQEIDLSLKPPSPKLSLYKPDKITQLCNLPEAFEINLDVNASDLDVLSFTLPYKLNINHQLQQNNHTSMLRNRYLIKLILGDYIQYFIIISPIPSANESSDYLEVNCVSLENELNDKKIKGLNLDAVLLSEALNGFSRDTTIDEVTTTSVTNGILKGTQWTLGNVPSSLVSSIYRSFEGLTGTKLEIIRREIADKYKVIAKFDTQNKVINFYETDEFGINDGLKISDKNYLRTITQTEDDEDFCTRLYIYGANSISIQGVNPIGTSFLEDYSYFLYPFIRDENMVVLSHSDYMSDELCHAILDYKQAMLLEATSYTELLAQLTAFQIALTAKNNEMKLLTDDMFIIDDNIKTNQDSGISIVSPINYKSQKIALQLLIDAKQIEVDSATALVTGVQSQINDLQDGLSESNHFTPELLEEKIKFEIDGEFSDDSITLDTDLYLSALDEMNDRKIPVPLLEISIVNFLEVLSEQRNWKKIVVGNKVAIQNEQLGIDSTASITKASFAFESGEIKLTISDIKKSKSARDKIAEYLYRTDSYVDIIDLNKQKWDESLIKSKEYVDIQIEEVNGTLLNLNIDVNRFSLDGYITKIESSALKNSLQQANAESEDFIIIANSLGLTDDIIPNEKINYRDALNALTLELNKWIDQTTYPIIILLTERDIIKTLFENVQNTKAILINKIALIREERAGIYTDDQVSEVNIAIANMLTNIADFAKDRQITYTEAIMLNEAFVKINNESVDIINIATGFVIDSAIINNYQNSLTGTIASCGIDGLEVELNNWVGYAELDYPIAMTRSQKKKLVNKFIYVNSTKKLLIEAIALATPAYTIDGQIYVKGTGANRNANRSLLINKKIISASSVSGRGLMLTVIDRSDLSVIFTQLYDTFADDQARLDLATKLDTLDNTVIITLTSYNSIGWNSTLLTSVIRCGGTGTDTGIGAYPYSLIGIPGIFKGTALEVISFSDSNAPYAEINTKIIDGLPVGVVIAESVLAVDALLYAQNAQISADISNGVLHGFAISDDITATEKIKVNIEWELIKTEKFKVEDKCTFYDAIEYPNIPTAKVIYETKYDDLSVYIIPILSDMATTSIIDNVVFEAKFKDYFDAKISLLNIIATSASSYITDKTSGIAESLVSLAIVIDQISLDSSVTEIESQTLLDSLNLVVEKSNVLLDLADVFGVTTEKINYQSALTNGLQVELNKLINQLSYPKVITSDHKFAIQTCFINVQSTKSLLLNKILSSREDSSTTTINETYIPLFYPAHTTYLSTTSYNEFKLVTMGSSNLVYASDITASNILYEIGKTTPWPEGTMFALEATWYTTNVTNPAEVSLCDKNGEIIFSSYMTNTNIIPRRIRSEKFSLPNGTDIGLGIRAWDSGAYCRLCKADLIVFPV